MSVSLQHFNFVFLHFRDQRRSEPIVTPALILTFFAFNPGELYTQEYKKNNNNNCTVKITRERQQWSGMWCMVEDKTSGKAAKKNKRKKKPGPLVHQAEMTHSQALMALCAGYYKVPTHYCLLYLCTAFLAHVQDCPWSHISADFIPHLSRSWTRCD